MNRDRYDLPLTTTSDRAAAHYRDGMDCMLSAWHGAEDAFDRAIREDGDFALAHIARARLHQLNMQGNEARNMAAHARQLAAGADARERQHIEVMAAVIEGKPKVAVSGAEAHLEEYPRDALVLSMLLGAFGLYAFSGRADHDAAKLAVCERVARHYGEDWWFLSYLGWSHTEAGNLATGRALSERAMGLRAENANAAHGLSHAMFEQGDLAAGRQFLSAWLPAHDRKSFLHGHLWWHISLTALDEGDLEGALAIYERQIKPADRPYPPLNIFTDGASLLWRLSLAGKSGLEPHWRDVAAYGEKYFPQAGAHFADVHHALAAAAIGGEALDTRLAQLEARAADGKLPPGRAAIDMCRGMRAFTDGDHDGAIRLLEPAMAELVRIGGSHAQRELWEDTLIVAYLRGGHREKAAGLISTRLERRPSARDAAWSREVQARR
ncbi:tetratricopeptide repeat protein [Bradyrhizobium sp. AUGA SZCCT0431]|uniref:tetratricopeptide repeat protein n=1 Tax=Bradyrhizobium sp. AUGA SZCCT0431 TaxID=2807674 RepID=UPI001BAD3FEE|nr:tetratricopeptide repeat protein [Bradyrhizobium sp. AUGA SZCCT0431]MBR1143231.1 tetratricopeptide repeat protein [Bradyrhizobium sp. AUGA SZCCT0431]